MNRFSDEIVLIVGGSSGIGKESAKLFAAQGAQVILLARGADRLLETAREIEKQGGKVETLTADVAVPNEVQKAADIIGAKFGRVDVLLYSAAVFYLSPVETMDLQLARQSMDINYWGAVNITQAMLPLIRKGKRKSLLFLSSLSAYTTPPFFTAYAATKYALRGFLLSLRQELNPEGIHVGMVSPGPVATPLIEKEIHQEMYRLPLGIPVLQPEAAAKGILQAVISKKQDLILPKRMDLAARLAMTFPSLVEMYYRATIPGWQHVILEQTRRSEEI
jgi:short-subunit dehydrogenase